MWYRASIFMRGETKGRPPADWLWEESVVLFDADSHEHATALATNYARSHETSYISGTGEKIHWIFDRVFSVYQFDEAPVSGTEVYSHFLRAAEVASLLTPFDD
jgi:hypothetical protein